MSSPPNDRDIPSPLFNESLADGRLNGRQRYVPDIRERRHAFPVITEEFHNARLRTHAQWCHLRASPGP